MTLLIGVAFGIILASLCPVYHLPKIFVLPMQFHVFNMDQKSATEVNLYGKFLDRLDLPVQTVRVTGIISPVYFLPTTGNEDALISEVKSFTTAVVSIERVKRANIFHKFLRRNLEMLKMTFSQRVSFSDFESDFCELVFTEFQNPVENLVISRGIRGPGIVELGSLKKNGVGCDEVTFVRNAKFPSLHTASISFETKGNSISKFVYFNKQKRLFFKAKVGKADDPSYRALPDSRGVVSHLNEVIRKDGADIIVVHNFHLRSRLDVRDKIFCDVFPFASGAIKGRDFSIQEICDFYRISKQSGLEGDAAALVEIFDGMSALSLAKEMAEISGYLLNRCLGNCRAERIEYMLLHELYARDYLFPSSTPRQGAKYAGGLVLEPSQGFYEDIVLLLDFNSLYPSIIQEFNVCFSTVGSCDFYLTENSQDILNNPDLLSSVSDCPEASFLPRILRSLVRRRRAVKEMISGCKSPEEKAVLDIRQRALKLTANSIYGCLGSPISRFCNYEMAAFITAKGREILNETRVVAEGMGMRVVYGDTDSIMIHTKHPGRLEHYSCAVESARALVAKVNAKYRNIEIELEKVFKKLLLYTKKKYAALVFDANGSYIETKGLDLVRRDFCRASTDLSRSILNIMLQDREVYPSGGAAEGHVGKGTGEEVSVVNNTRETVEKVYTACAAFYSTLPQRPVEDFVISCVLSKGLEDYGTASNLPHVNLAVRLKATKGMVYLQDDVVSYVIGEGEGSVSSRAFHPEEDFKIDYAYYVKNQILPPLFRLVSVLSHVHPEKIGMIFNVRDCVPKAISKNLTFMVPCCEGIQEPSHNCARCNEPVPKEFYIQKVCAMLDEGCSRSYRAKGECAECGVVYSNHLYRCAHCNKDLRFDFKNHEFDSLLSSIESSFSGLKIPEIDHIVANYSAISSYRMIDMNKYFENEILCFKDLQQAIEGVGGPGSSWV